MTRMIIDNGYLPALLQQARIDGMVDLPNKHERTNHYLKKGLNSDLRRQLCSSLLISEGISYFNPDIPIKWGTIKNDLGLSELETSPVMVDEDFLKEKAELFRGIIISKSKQTKIPITQSEFQHLIHNAENIHYYSPDKKRIERKDEAEIFENYLASKGNLSLEEKKIQLQVRSLLAKGDEFWEKKEIEKDKLYLIKRLVVDYDRLFKAVKEHDAILLTNEKPVGEGGISIEKIQGKQRSLVVKAVFRGLNLPAPENLNDVLRYRNDKYFVSLKEKLIGLLSGFTEESQNPEKLKELEDETRKKLIEFRKRTQTSTLGDISTIMSVPVTIVGAFLGLTGVIAGLSLSLVGLYSMRSQAEYFKDNGWLAFNGLED